MRRLAAVAILAMACGGGAESTEPAAPADPAAGAKDGDLSWLVGTWERDDGFEHWHKISDTLWFGVSFTVKDGKTAGWETMIISDDGGKRTLTAIPDGKKQAEFAATAQANARIVFSLPGNDFPHTLEYRRDGAALVAMLLGTGDRKLEIRHRQGAPAQAEPLETADREFAAAVATGRLEAWVGWFAPDGAMFTDAPQVGHDAIRAVMKPAFDDPTFRVDWHPVHSALSPAGDIGYTIGRSTFFRGEGKEPHHCGAYITLWKKHDGQWRAMFDTGTQAPCGG